MRRSLVTLQIALAPALLLLTLNPAAGQSLAGAGAANSATRASTDAAVRAANRAATDAAVRSATRASTDAAVRSANLAATDAAVRSATRATTDAAVRTATRASLDAALRTSQRVSTDAAIRSAARTSTDGALRSANRFSSNAALQTGARARSLVNSPLLRTDAMSQLQLIGRSDAQLQSPALRSQLGLDVAARARTRVSTQDVRTRAQFALNQRLAQVERMRDRAVETGNTTLLDASDRLEAQARAQFRAEVQAGLSMQANGNRTGTQTSAGVDGSQSVQTRDAAGRAATSFRFGGRTAAGFQTQQATRQSDSSAVRTRTQADSRIRSTLGGRLEAGEESRRRGLDFGTRSSTGTKLNTTTSPRSVRTSGTATGSQSARARSSR